MQREAIINIVGFLGSGKTTLLKYLTVQYIDKDWSPYIILNDYENASLDAQSFKETLDDSYVRALNGSCICCSGIVELRNMVNDIPQRNKGVTLIEANGTSDACALMSFLGVGLKEHFLPPVQIATVDVLNWQLRGDFNDLESNQVQLSSILVLTHLDQVDSIRKSNVIDSLQNLNPIAQILEMDQLEVTRLIDLLPCENIIEKLDHYKSHWSSCSIDLPFLSSQEHIYTICERLPKSILRVKGCTKIGEDKDYTYFERCPDGRVYIKPYYGIPITGAKLLAIGVGSTTSALQDVVDQL